MGGDDHRSTANDGGATVERTVDVQDQGAIVRLRVSTDHDDEVGVDVEDELPVGLDPERVAFHPDHAPDEGEASADGVAFEGTVSDNDDLLVVYGAEVDGSAVSDVALTDPHLTVNSDLPDQRGGVTGLIRRALGRGQATADGGTSVESSDSVGDFESFPDEEERDAGDTDGDTRAEQSTDAPPAADDEESTGETPLDDLEPAVTRAESDSEAAEEPETDTDPDATDESDESEAAAPENETTSTDTGAGAAAAGAGAGGVAAALATEIENDEVAEEDLAVLQDELGEELAASDAARLDHLQARVEEFGAYAETLGTFLDEEGEPDEVIADLRDDIETLEDDVATLRDLESDVEDVQGTVDDIEAEVAAAADERAALREDIDTAAAEVAAVEDELGEEIEAVGSELADDIERVERQARAAREGVKSDLAEIEAAIERVEEVREALEDAFAPLGTETGTGTGAVESERDGNDAEQAVDDAEVTDGGPVESAVESDSGTEADPDPDTTTDESTADSGADGDIDLSVVEEDSDDDPADSGLSLDL